MKSYSTFETNRLILRPTTEDDAPFLVELLNSPKMLKYVGDRNVRTIEDAREYVKNKITPQLQKLGFANYTVFRKSDMHRLGTCGLYDREGLDGIDIGYAFLPEYERNGYAFEAACKIKEVAFTHFGIQKIIAITSKENLASIKLLEKLGMRYKQLVQLPNDEEELLLYELTSQEIN